MDGWMDGWMDERTDTRAKVAAGGRNPRMFAGSQPGPLKRVPASSTQHNFVAYHRNSVAQHNFVAYNRNFVAQHNFVA